MQMTTMYSPVMRLTSRLLSNSLSDGIASAGNATRCSRRLYGSAKHNAAAAAEDGSAQQGFSGRMLSRLSVLGRLFTRQANIYIYNRVRRALQLQEVYRSAFGQQFFRAFTSNLLRRLSRRRPSLFVLGAIAFNFKNEGISDEDVESCINEFEILKKPPAPTLGRCPQTGSGNESPESGRLNLEQFKVHLHSQGFEPVVNSERLHIWRKSEPNKPNYTYKVHGTFTDISARTFFRVQCDTEYRKEWDKLVVQLDVIDKDRNNDVIYWHMHYPFPLRPRDYVFIRRSVVDIERACMVVVSHATCHPDRPPRSDAVRVDQYMSNMVISPHKSFDENGFDYLLTYYDDPQSSFPSPVYAWMAASGVHDYVDKLHHATKTLSERLANSGDANSANVNNNSGVSLSGTTKPLRFSQSHPQSQYA